MAKYRDITFARSVTEAPWGIREGYAYEAYASVDVEDAEAADLLNDLGLSRLSAAEPIGCLPPDADSFPRMAELIARIAGRFHVDLCDRHCLAADRMAEIVIFGSMAEDADFDVEAGRCLRLGDCLYGRLASIRRDVGSLLAAGARFVEGHRVEAAPEIFDGWVGRDRDYFDEVLAWRAHRVPGAVAGFDPVQGGWNAEQVEGCLVRHLRRWAARHPALAGACDDPVAMDDLRTAIMRVEPLSEAERAHARFATTGGALDRSSGAAARLAGIVADAAVAVRHRRDPFVDGGVARAILDHELDTIEVREWMLDEGFGRVG